MGDRKYFHVESKSFDLIKEAGTNGICIIECGKNYMSSIALGKEGATWVQSLMVEAANTSSDKQLLKTFREANKVFVCQKQWNEWFIDLRDGRRLRLLMDIQGSMVGQTSL
jgi:hypothetical protein